MSATWCTENTPAGKVMIDPCFPIPHEFPVMLLRKRLDESITFRAQACVSVGNYRLRSALDRAQLNGQFARGDGWGDFDHLHEAIARFMSGDVPDCITRTRLCEKNTIGFSCSGFAENNEWVPAVDPIRLAHGAQQREYFRRLSHKLLCKGPRDTVGFRYYHLPVFS